ncbi:hypothetical protein DXA92_04720 [Agathobaculum butyriciproducens]|nr:hypothetical protein DXA92_04720 [Agathobaculum butyriciproducens]
MAALVLLCGCGRSAEMSAEDVRAHFASLDSCTAHLKIISDLDESVLEFESDYVYNREDSDSFTLTAPESVAGIGGRISGEENGAFTLQYNDLQLDDIAPRHTGLTPADAWFCLLNDLRYAVPAQVWSEHTNGESCSCCAMRRQTTAWKSRCGCGRAICSRSMPSCMRTVRAC